MGEFLIKKFGGEDSIINFEEFVDMLIYLWDLHSLQRVAGCGERINTNL